MKTLCFYMRDRVVYPLFSLLLLFSVGQLSAESLSGHVYDECTGDPIAGADVAINNGFGNYHSTTDMNGLWVFNFLSGDPTGQYSIFLTSPQGANSPGYYIHNHPGGSQSGLDFNVLPKVFDITINGETVFWQNNPSSPHTVCTNGKNCVELVGNGDDLPFEPNEAYCYKLSLYQTDASGQQGKLLAESGCTNFTMPQIGTCGNAAFDLGALLAKIEKIPKVIRMEVVQFCCGKKDDCTIGDGALVNTEVVFIEVRNLSPADADFMFTTSPGSVIDIGEADGLIPRGDCQSVPGAELGPSFCGIDASFSIGNEIADYQVILEEIDCQTGQVVGTIWDSGLVPAPNGTLPASILFNGENQTSGFFSNPANTNGKCFRATLNVFNPCGVSSACGNFFITDQCNFCLIVNPNENGMQVSPHAQDIDQSKQHSIAVEVWPNPVSEQMNFQYVVTEESNVYLSVYDVTGKKIVELVNETQEKGVHDIGWDAAGVNGGVYFYRLAINSQWTTGKVFKK